MGGYKPPIVYCVKKFYDCIISMENAAIKLTESDECIATLSAYVEARGGKKMSN